MQHRLYSGEPALYSGKKHNILQRLCLYLLLNLTVKMSLQIKNDNNSFSPYTTQVHLEETLHFPERLLRYFM